MIYKPQESLGLANFLYAGFISALKALAADFNAGTNKPWTYYLGVGIGGSCVATGVPGAAATAWVLAAGLDMWIFKSPNGSLVKFYVNGLQRAVQDASGTTSGWIKVHLDLDPNVYSRIDVENGAPGADNTSGISWMAISQLESPGIITSEGDPPVSLVVASLSVTDADGDISTAPVNIPLGALTITQIAGFLQGTATDLDAITEGKITSINLVIDVDLPSGLKSAPVANSDVQEAGLITYVAANTKYVWSQLIPAFVQSKFSGKNINLADSAVSTFTTRMVSGATVSGALVQPSDKYENDLQSVKRGTKRFRK